MSDTNRRLIKVFVESANAALARPDMDSIGHECAQPFRTGAFNRMGKSGQTLPEEHMIVIDAAMRASEKTGYEVIIIDISEWGLLKRLRANEADRLVPRIEVSGRVLVGNPTSDEIAELCR